MKNFGNARRIAAIAVAMAVVLVAVPFGIGAMTSAEQVQDTVSAFEVDLSGLRNGEVKNSKVVSAIEDGFYVYNAQRASQNGHTSYFERDKVNGYVTEQDGKLKFPDTGVSAACDLDGTGSLADKAVPTWSLQDGWLSCSAYNGEDAFLFRQGNFLYTKSNTVSGFALVKNFALETGFRFSTVAENDALAVIFRAKEAGMAVDPYQYVLAFNAAGKLYLGKPTDFETGLAYNDELKSADGAALQLEKDRAYVLSLTVVGQKLTLTIKEGDTVLATYQKDDLALTGYENGYLAIGTSNNGPAIADVRVQQLDDAGAAVDFGTALPGYPFGLVAASLGTYRTRYYADIGDGAQVFEDNWYTRSDAKTGWYDFWSARQGSEAWVGNGMTEADAQLTKLFATYHEQISASSQKRLFAKSAKYSDRVGAELTLGDGQTAGQGYVNGGDQLLLLGNSENNRLLGWAMTIAPRTAAGEQIVAKDLETSFATTLYNNNERAMAFSLRSASMAAVVNDDATAGYADKVTVVLSGAGYKILDGEALAISGNEYTPWDGGKVLDGENVNVTIKALGDKLTVKVTSNAGDVYLDNTAAPITLKTARSGYCYFSALNGYGYFRQLGLARLNEQGEQTDVDQNPDVTVETVDYSPVTAEIDRAKGQTLSDASLPAEINGVTDEGFSITVPVQWVSEDYRSYKDGSFTFKAVSSLSYVKIADAVQPTATVVNRINGEYDTKTSRKYYFDSANDLKDFLCHISSVDTTASGTVLDPTMTAVDPAQYWSIENGKVAATYSRTLDTGFNALTRATDVSTMVLADADMALVNFQLDIDYTHGTSDNWFPYVMTNIQNPEQFYANVKVSSTSDLTTGRRTEFTFPDKTKNAGVWMYLNKSGAINFWGAVQKNGATNLSYSTGITSGNDFFTNYDKNVQHHMTIRVLNDVVSLQVDGSDVYRARLDEVIGGGYIGFAACGDHASFDNLMITALDGKGQPTDLSAAEKGFAPEPLEDTYKPWDPLESEWAFEWKAPYTD